MFWVKEPSRSPALEEARRTTLVKTAWQDGRKAYGYLKTCDDLVDMGETASENRGTGLARLAGVQAQIGYKKKPGVSGGKPSIVVHNRLGRQFAVDERCSDPDQRLENQRQCNQVTFVARKLDAVGICATTERNPKRRMKPGSETGRAPSPRCNNNQAGPPDGGTPPQSDPVIAIAQGYSRRANMVVAIAGQQCVVTNALAHAIVLISQGDCMVSIPRVMCHSHWCPKSLSRPLEITPKTSL